MRRRTVLKTLAGAGAAASLPAASIRPIQLHVDLNVDPAREREMLANFHGVFRPAIRKQPGFVSVRMLKLRQVMAGTGPAPAPYRLAISFQTEERRQAWVKTDDHQRVWPEIEKTLAGSKFSAVLYDEA